jgi:4-aminobutyrate aminotransferase-like enzyme/Ser/Thr protein kinase RdoA (MazF antagonist)
MLEVERPLPVFTNDDASQIAAAFYGLRATAEALPGEFDHNFFLKTEDGQAFVLKIASAAEQPALLEMQNAALKHLAARDPSLTLPQVRASLAGEETITVTAASGAQHLARLLTYVPGALFAEVKPHTPHLLRSLGSILGRLDAGLSDFAHPAARRFLKWDLQHALWIREYLQHVTQPERRASIEQFLALFEAQAMPLFPALRTSIIHNDANDYNILVNGVSAQPREVVSLVDFGDMVQTYTVCEVAIAAAYAMMGKADPLTAAARVVAGYHEAFSLTEPELEALYPLICARLCVSVVNSAYQQTLKPHDDYVTISEQPAWALLEQLAQIPPALAHYTFRAACHLPPCPQTGALVQWLKDHQGELRRVVEPDLRIVDTLVFDLSIGSPEVPNLTEAADVERFTRRLFDRMDEAGVEVAIGRYNEPRLIYTTDLFKVPGNEGPEWRTVHIGLDVFMRAGAAVLAPLDGVVHSFQNNTALLDYGPTIILQHTIAEQGLTFYTLYGHLSEDSLEGLYEGKPIARGTRIASIGNYPINGNWPPHLHFQIITDLLGRVGEFPGVARPSQREVWLSLCPDPNLLVGVPAERFPSDGLSFEETRRLRAQHIGKSLSISYQNPLKMVRGSGQYLYDVDGRAYLDAVNNVSHVGHSHPRVVKAGQEQMAVLNTNTRYLHDHLVRYAERLCATLPPELSVCFFVCSGSEANELALRLARTHTGRKDVIVLDAAYHGNTTALVEISPYKYEGPGGAGQQPYIHKALMPDDYRGAFKRSDPEAGKKYALAVEEIIRQAEKCQTPIAAFIGESLLGCGGQIVLPDYYLEDVYRHVRAAGGVCIADEVQVGFGRVGTHFWGFETQGVVPDIVTMGKPIGNGHPLAAVVTTPEIAASFDNGMEYFNTFGGNPVSCAIGLAVLDVIADEHLQANALWAGERLLAGLRGLMDKHRIIGDVRGLGLFVGVELVLDRETLAPAAAQASYVVNRMRDRGILMSTDGPLHNVLKIKPPLVFSEANAETLVAVLDDILAEDFARL